MSRPVGARILAIAAAACATLALAGTGQAAEPITVTISNATVVEGTVRPGHPEDKPRAALITVRLSRPASVEVNISLGWPIPWPNDAPSGKASLDDVGGTGGVIYGLKPGETKATLRVWIAGDDRPEPNETFEIGLFQVHPLSPEDVVEGGAATVTIIDDDGKKPPPPPKEQPPAEEPALAIEGAQELEGDAGGKRFVFPVRLSAKSAETVTVGYRTQAYRKSLLDELMGREFDTVSPKRAAEAGTDYIPLRGTLSFAPGERRKEIVVTVVGDQRPEPDEAFVVELHDPKNARFAVFEGAALGTILDDDAERELRVFGASGQEGNVGGRQLVFRVTLVSEKPASRPVEVEYRTRDDEAKAGRDYRPVQGRLTFRPGERRKEIAVTVFGDRVFEKVVESFTVELANATNATVVSGPGRGAIEDDDAEITISDESEREDFDFGLVFEVRLREPAEETVKVPFETRDGTARAGQDYRAERGVLTFAPGETRKTIAVQPIDDRVREPKEAFLVVLLPPTEWFGFDFPTSVKGTGTIENDD